MTKIRLSMSLMSGRLRVVAALCVVASVCGACPPLRMTHLATIPVINRSDDTLHLFVNEFYPDTSTENAWSSSYVLPHDRGGLGIVNRSWDAYLVEKGRITLILAKGVRLRPEKGRPERQKVILGTMTLTKEVLDSLGWVITYPPE